jgi:hypothetical protein
VEQKNKRKNLFNPKIQLIEIPQKLQIVIKQIIVRSAVGENE